MDAADLKFFEAVARLGNMSRAAAELHTVQSNVTARIREFEARLGAPLFVRHARGVELAPAGRRLLPHARRVLHMLAEAHRVARDDGTPEGPLVIGALETTTALRLAPALARFTAAYPAVDLTVRTGTTCELLAQVLDNALEGAFVCGPVADPALEVETVFVPCFRSTTHRADPSLSEDGYSPEPHLTPPNTSIAMKRDSITRATSFTVWIMHAMKSERPAKQ